MEKRKKRANVVTHNVFLKYFCKMGKMDEANVVLNEMLEKGLVPNRITYEIINSGMIEKGYVPDIRGYTADVSKSLTSS